MDQAKLDHIEWAVDCLKSRMDAEERTRSDAKSKFPPLVEEIYKFLETHKNISGSRTSVGVYLGGSNGTIKTLEEAKKVPYGSGRHWP